eukprot:PhM_4_TR5052/c0_g2_i1/m.44292
MERYRRRQFAPKARAVVPLVDLNSNNNKKKVIGAVVPSSLRSPTASRPTSSGIASASTASRPTSSSFAAQRDPALLSAMQQLERWRANASNERESFDSIYVWAQMSLAQVETMAAGLPTPNVHTTGVAMEVLESLVPVLGRFGPVLSKIVSILRDAIYVAPEMREKANTSMQRVCDGSVYRRTTTHFEMVRDLILQFDRTHSKLQARTRAAEGSRHLVVSVLRRHSTLTLSKVFTAWRRQISVRDERCTTLLGVFSRSTVKSVMTRAFYAWKVQASNDRAMRKVMKERGVEYETQKQLLKEVEALRFLQNEGTSNANKEIQRTVQSLNDTQWQLATMEKEMQKQKSKYREEITVLKDAVHAWHQAATRSLSTFCPIGVDPFLDALIDDVVPLLKWESTRITTLESTDHIKMCEKFSGGVPSPVPSPKAAAMAMSVVYNSLSPSLTLHHPTPATRDSVERMLRTWTNLHLRAANSSMLMNNIADLRDGLIFLSLIQQLELLPPELPAVDVEDWIGRTSANTTPTSARGGPAAAMAFHMSHIAPAVYHRLSVIFTSFGRFPLLAPLLTHNPRFASLFHSMTVLGQVSTPSSWYWWVLATIFVARAVLPARPVFSLVEEHTPKGLDTTNVFDTFNISPAQPGVTEGASVPTPPPTAPSHSLTRRKSFGSITRSKSLRRTTTSLSRRQSRTNSMSTMPQQHAKTVGEIEGIVKVDDPENPNSRRSSRRTSRMATADLVDLTLVANFSSKCDATLKGYQLHFTVARALTQAVLHGLWPDTVISSPSATGTLFDLPDFAGECI